MYNKFNPSKPAGADTPPVYSADDLNNIRALRDAVVCGFMPGWSFALGTAGGGSVYQPTSYTWISGALGLRMLLAYGGGGNVATLAWEYTENSGGLWTNINTGGTPASVTSDLTNNSLAIMAQDKDAGIATLVLNGIQRALRVELLFNAHQALIGEAAHGLGTLSVQDANAVAITDGTIMGVSARLLKRLTPAATPLLASGSTWDWAAVPTMARIAAGGSIANIIGADDGEMKRLLVVGNGPITIASALVLWGVGHPTWGTNGTMVNMVYASAPGKLYATTIPF